MGFGRVLGEYREAKIIDFRVFFMFFRSKNLNANWKGKKPKKWTSRRPRAVQTVHQPSGPTPQGRGRGGIISYANMRIYKGPPLNALRPRPRRILDVLHAEAKENKRGADSGKIAIK